MATRFYLPSSGVAPLGALGFSSSWEDTSIATRLPLPIVKSSTVMTTVAFDDNNNVDADILFRQYQSDTLASQTIAAQTFEFQIRGAIHLSGNSMFVSIGARVVSMNGSVVRGTLFDVTRDNTVLTTTLTNRRFTITTNEVIAQAGDRIIIEIGTGGDPSGGNDHDTQLRIGDVAASDLAENDTSTVDNNPWVEFPIDIVFGGAADAHKATFIQNKFLNLYRATDIN